MSRVSQHAWLEIFLLRPAETLRNISSSITHSPSGAEEWAEKHKQVKHTREMNTMLLNYIFQDHFLLKYFQDSVFLFPESSQDAKKYANLLSIRC